MVNKILFSLVNPSNLDNQGLNNGKREHPSMLGPQMGRAILQLRGQITALPVEVIRLHLQQYKYNLASS